MEDDLKIINVEYATINGIIATLGPEEKSIL